jgi:hypothetical protein
LVVIRLGKELPLLLQTTRVGQVLSIFGYEPGGALVLFNTDTYSKVLVGINLLVVLQLA